MKVGFATADWSSTVVEEDGTPSPGGSHWIRIGQYLKHISVEHTLGVLVFSHKLGIFGVTDPKGNHHLDCDVIYMQRWMLSGIPENMDIAKSNGQIIINDLDDWYWGLHDSHMAKSFIDPKANKDENTNIYRDVISKSDLVVVSTPFLAEKAKSKLRAKEIVIFENCVDFDAYPQREHTDENPTVIGWHGSTGHRSKDLDEVKGVFPQLAEKDFSFHHTGFSSLAPPFWEETNIPQGRVNLYPMVSPTKLPKMLPFDIGVAPLNDIAFNHAKSWIKPLEYIAAGIPFVASKTPEYLRLKNEYGVGRYAGKFIEWKKAFDAFSDPQTRIEEAKKNREAVQSLDVKEGALRLEKILESVI